MTRESISGVVLGALSSTNWFVHWFTIGRTASVPAIKIRVETEKTPLPNYHLAALQKDHKKLYIGDVYKLRNYIDNFYAQELAQKKRLALPTQKETAQKKRPALPTQETAQKKKPALPTRQNDTPPSVSHLYQQVSPEAAARINNSAENSLVTIGKWRINQNGAINCAKATLLEPL